MLVEKNICDSVIGTLLSIKGKIEDGVKAQLDLVKPIEIPKTRHDGRCEGKSTQM